MRIFFLFSVLVFGLLINKASSQNFSKDYWHFGKVYLFSGDSVTGKIQYDLDQNSIVVSSNNTLKSFNSSQVEQFWIKDALQEKIRYFYSLPQKRKDDYRALYFFELLAEGRLTFLCRENFVVRQTGYNSPFMWGGWVNGGTYVVQEDDYYHLNRQGDVIDVEESQEAIMELFGNDKLMMEQHLENTKNRMRNRADLLDLISFYNNQRS